MQLAEVMASLEQHGSAATRKVLINHGAPASTYGVKVADLKKIARQIKGEQALALALYHTGQADAQYLAGLVADGRRMDRPTLQRWAEASVSAMIAEYTVAWVASESPEGRSLAMAWMDAPSERVASTGWSTYAGLVAITPDAALDVAEVERLLDRVAEDIHAAPNRVRYCMNGLVIAVGAYVAPLLPKALSVAERVGKVKVDMNGTACKVPPAREALAKIESMGRVGKKRKTIRC